MRDKVDENGIMSKWHRDGTWQSEFARGMGLFVKDNNLWDEQVDYTSDKKLLPIMNGCVRMPMQPGKHVNELTTLRSMNGQNQHH